MLMNIEVENLPLVEPVERVDLIIRDVPETEIESLAQVVGHAVEKFVAPEPVEVIKEVEKELPEELKKLLAVIDEIVENKIKDVEEKYAIYKSGYEAFEKLFKEFNASKVTE